MPKVSIIIPAYNASTYVADAIHSALMQTWADKEIIVVDDGSTDATALIAESIAGVTCIRQTNGGVSRARNAGVSHSSGDLIAFLDADDVWHPGKLEAQVSLLERYPDCDLTYTKFIEIPSPLAPREWLCDNQDISSHSRAVELKSSFIDPFFGTSTVIVRRTAFDHAGGFDESLPYAEDIDFFLRVLIRRPATAMLDAAMVYKREVDGSLSHDSAAGYAKLIGVYRNLFEAHPALNTNHPGMASSSYARLHCLHAASLVRNGERFKGGLAAFRSLGAQPSLAACIVLGRACIPGFALRIARRARHVLMPTNSSHGK